MGRQTVSVILGSDGLARVVRRGAYRLRVTRGPDRRRQLRVTGARLLIGTGPICGLRLTDPTVSAVHCEIETTPEGFQLRDLGSRNGTWSGERRLIQCWLNAKDSFAVARTMLGFEALDEADDVALSARSSFVGLVGGSVRMRELYDQLARLAGSDTTVLLHGETGTGKEVAADALVAAGPRASAPFVIVDCARLPAGIAEAELFGHERGAFTGAERAVSGAFERAQGGTVFLDEVGELPEPLQKKLLGVLERREVTRLGGDHPIPIDVRVIAATHRDLARAVNHGTFRADLFFRLAVAVVQLPPLREHPEDIPALVAHFLAELPGTRSLPPDVLERLYSAEYAGNVRELRNTVERAALGLDPQLPMAPGSTINLDEPYRLQRERVLASFERGYFSRLLEACGGNVSEAARRAGVSRAHLHVVLSRVRL